MYYFQHDDYTGPDRVCVGSDEFEALEALEADYGLSLEQAFAFCMSGNVWQTPLKG